jgi:hypothetical protein
MIGDHAVSVVMTSENGRLDVNEADPKLIDQALRRLGVDGQSASLITARLTLQRAAQQTVASFAALRAILGEAVLGEAGSPCLFDSLALSSGPHQANTSARPRGPTPSVTSRVSL